jgi:RNA polymerase sigma-70 factor (ECF subfamily)
MTQQPRKGDMDERAWLTERFEESRPHLRGVAYRMLGSLSEAEDAVQEAWLRLARSDASGIENLGGWLTTVVARVCLDLLRARSARREQPLRPQAPLPIEARSGGDDPEHEAALADSVGVALLVVLETLSPAERLAFVLHDLFGTPFEEIAAILGRSPAAAKQLASRARRRVRGSPAPSHTNRARQREVLEAFLRAARSGDLAGLLAVLDPEAVIHIEAAARIDAPPKEVGRPREVRGAAQWAEQFLALSRRLQFVQLALVDGSLGLVHAPRGQLSRVLVFTFAGEKVVRVEVIADAARLRELEIATLS